MKPRVGRDVPSLLVNVISGLLGKRRKVTKMTTFDGFNESRFKGRKTSEGVLSGFLPKVVKVVHFSENRENLMEVIKSWV